MGDEPSNLVHNPVEPSSVDLRLARRLAELRQERGWSLDDLATRSGLSRASLSRFERGETSPTASVLGRLCTAYGRTMSRLLGEVESEPTHLIRAADQTIWVDPASGFRRRSISSPAAGYAVEVMAGELPAGAVVDYETPPVTGLEQHILLQSGHLAFTHEAETFDLRPGDCLRVRLFGPTRFTCPGPEPARYIIAICPP